MTRQKALVAALLATAIVLPAGMAVAQERPRSPGPDWITQEQAAQKLTAAGYTNVTRLKADKRSWEAKALKDGRIVDVKVDPRSGAVAEERADDEDDDD